MAKSKVLFNTAISSNREAIYNRDKACLEALTSLAGYKYGIEFRTYIKNDIVRGSLYILRNYMYNKNSSLIRAILQRDVYLCIIDVISLEELAHTREIRKYLLNINNNNNNNKQRALCQ